MQRSTVMAALGSVFLSLIFAAPVLAQKKGRLPLDQHLAEGPLRVWYRLTGEDAVDLTDVNQNGVPDQPENLAIQMGTAFKLFVNVLKFPNPIKSPRYKGVKYLDFSLRHRTQWDNNNGIAFDELQPGRSIDPRGTKILTVGIATSINPAKNHTPTHEVFHIIQYGATYFKNRWFTEGTARWSEHAVAKDGIGEYRYDPSGPWPQKPGEQQALFGMAFEAEFYLWNPIAFLDDNSGDIPRKSIPPELLAAKYADGTPVLKDLSLNGSAIIRDVLLELGRVDDIAARQLGYNKWTEDNQRSSRNDPYFYQAVMNVVDRRLKKKKK
jgi:hypothetical protein